MLHWDRDLKGFAVLCSGTTNVKTYVVQRALPKWQKSTCARSARCNTLSLEKASELAKDRLHDLRHGRDPKAKVENPTLRETFENYLAARRDLRPASVTLYRYAVEKPLAAWLDQTAARDHRRYDRGPVTAAIAASISKGGVSDGIVTANAAMRTFRTLYNFASERTAGLPDNPVRRLLQAMVSRAETRAHCARREDGGVLQGGLQAEPSGAA